MAKKASGETAADNPFKAGPQVGRAGAKFHIRSQVFKKIKRRFLDPDPLNWRTHGDGQIAALSASLSEIGFVGALLVRPKPRSKTRFYVLDGHARLEQFAADDPIPCCVIRISDSDARKLLASYDPITGMAGTDRDILDQLLDGIEFQSEELDGMIASVLADAPVGEITLEPDDVAENELEPEKSKPSAKRREAATKLMRKWKTKRGQVWGIESKTGAGVHRLMIGDVTHEQEVAKLLDGVGNVDVMLADPPYCSGGFQEAGKSEGSIGTDDDSEEIHGDRISTRGFRNLMKCAFKSINPGSSMVFTDWRMWSHVTDIVEEEGHAIRQMIVWDKTYAGFGAGFRAQHELICFGHRRPLKFDPSLSGGNVIQCARTGNKRHPSEKPIDVLLYLLRVHCNAATVCDPFAGSGTTMIASEQKGRTFYGMELVPRYVAVALERAADAGLDPQLIQE